MKYLVLCLALFSTSSWSAIFDEHEHELVCYPYENYTANVTYDSDNMKNYIFSSSGVDVYLKDGTYIHYSNGVKCTLTRTSIEEKK